MRSYNLIRGFGWASNFVKNTPLRVVFSSLFSVSGYPDETLSLELVFDILLQVNKTTFASLEKLKFRVLILPPKSEPKKTATITTTTTTTQN